MVCRLRNLERFGHIDRGVSDIRHDEGFDLVAVPGGG